MMTRCLAIAIALAACNQALGIESTRLYDAAPPDAAPTCPTQGAPEFSKALVEVFVQTCFDYTFSSTANRAVALCTQDGPFFLFEGELDRPLALIPELSTYTGAAGLSYARLSPDGLRLYALRGSSLLRFAHTGSGWILDTTIVGVTNVISTIARGAAGDRLIAFDAPANAYREWEIDAAGVAHPLPLQFTPSDLGVPSINLLRLSSDGLHLTFETAFEPTASRLAMAYTSRLSPSDAFGTAVPVLGLPATGRLAFMTDDCGRAYLSGLGRILYAPQR